jgi:nucleoside-diphosphate-sugar epimerase
VCGTKRLLHGLRDFEVEQFLFASTMLVHRPCRPGERIDEDGPLDPKWDYPKSKVAAEQLILRERGNVPVVLLRIGGVYDDRCHSIPLAQQIGRIYEKRFIGHILPGDITHGVAFVHMEDMVEALMLAVEHRKELPEVTTLLIGNGKHSVTMSYNAPSASRFTGKNGRRTEFLRHWPSLAPGSRTWCRAPTHSLSRG